MFFSGCVYYGFITTLLGITQISLLAAIAFDRYVIIVKPTRFTMTSRCAVKLVLGCYCYGFLWALFPGILCKQNMQTKVTFHTLTS